LAQAVLAATVITVTCFAADLKHSIVPNFFEAKPDSQQLGPCHGGLVIDKVGQIYVTTDTKRGIVVFSPEGKYLRAVGPSNIHGLELREENGTNTPLRTRVRARGRQAKLDGSQRGITFQRKPAFKQGAKGLKVTVAPMGPFSSPTAMAELHLKFDKNRKFVKAFGGSGAEEGKFNTCHIAPTAARGSRFCLFATEQQIPEHGTSMGAVAVKRTFACRLPYIRGDYALFRLRAASRC
jgi:hypothetical protein